MKPNETKPTLATGTAAVDHILQLNRALEALRAEMTGLTPLGLEERSRLPKFSARSVRITEQRLKASQLHPTGLPPEFDLAGFAADVVFTDALQKCLATVEILRSDLSDTLVTTGYRAYRSGSVAFAYLKAANLAKANLSGTLEELRRKRRTSVAAAGAEADRAAGKPSVPGPGSGSPGSPAAGHTTEGEAA